MIIVTHAYPCDRCHADAAVVQWKYRNNADDRNGPLVLYRCAQHTDASLPAEQLEVRP